MKQGGEKEEGKDRWRRGRENRGTEGKSSGTDGKMAGAKKETRVVT